MSEPAIAGIVVVHFDAVGEISYHAFGNEVRLFIVDERAPDDRVYEWLSRGTPQEFRTLIPEGSTAGSSLDSRHAAMAARIEAVRCGRPHLVAIDGEQP